MSVLWCERALLAGADRPETGVVIELAGDRIAGIQAGVPAPPVGAQRLGGLVLPGFANAHSHAFQRALRGRTQRATGSFWTWREQMYRAASTLDPDSMQALARATFGEMTLAGITVVGEFHYVHHGPGGIAYEQPNEMGFALARAAYDAGLRLTLIDACYLHGGVGGSEPDPVQRRFCDPDAEAWAARVDGLTGGPRLRIGAAIHSVRAVDPQSAAVVASWANGRRAPLHAHLSEQPAENEDCQTAYGMTPTELLWEAGALSERFTAVHATHVTERDVELLGAARSTVCMCPTTERDLADGVGPARPLRDRGVALAVGSDSNAIIEPLEEARAVELDQRLVTGARGGHGGAELLRAATAGGYAALGWPQGGTIAPGALADLVTLRVDSVRLAGTPAQDLVDAVVFAASAADVTDVIVGGRFVVRSGVHQTFDVERELAEAM